MNNHNAPHTIAEYEKDDDEFNEILIKIGNHINNKFINSESSSESNSETDSDSEIKRESLINIGAYLQQVSDEINNEIDEAYYNIMSKVFNELLSLNNNYISEEEWEELFYLSDDSNDDPFIFL
jgi:hypothetical protein